MNSISDVWQSVLSRLQEQLSETTIRTWFDEVDVVTMEDSAFVLHCSNSFKKSTIETRFMKHIKAALKDIFSSDLEVKILNDEQLAAYHGVAPDQPGSLLDSDAFTFETYVVGPQNKLAYAAARAVADKPALCSSTATPDWARPICSTPLPIRSSASGRTCGSCTSRATTSPTS